jgi:hypothetical protein
VLFIGDDWAEDHHDLEREDETGRRLARAPVAGRAGGHHPIPCAGRATFPGGLGGSTVGGGRGRVVIGIETDRGPWVTALRAAGCRVFAINRCPRRGTGSGTPRPARSRTPAMLMCSRRSSGWIPIIAG